MASGNITLAVFYAAYYAFCLRTWLGVVTTFCQILSELMDFAEAAKQLGKMVEHPR